MNTVLPSWVDRHSAEKRNGEAVSARNRVSRSSVGFTLIELLVVIAILALLVAFLMPVLGNMRSSAQQTKCLQRLRQIQTASLSYAAENNSMFPPANRQFGLPHEFFKFEETLGKYLSEHRDTVMFCPGEMHEVRNAKTPLYNTNYTTYQYFNIPGPFQGTFSTGKPDMSRTVTIPSSIALWGCLTLKRTDGTVLAHREPLVKKPLSGMNAVYPDGHAKWVSSPDLEAFWEHSDGSKYHWPKPPAQIP